MRPDPTDTRPRILLLIDIPNWAFHSIARAVVRHLGDRFAFTILIKDQYPHIEENWFDIVHVFYEFEEYHRQFLHGKAKVIRSVYSHYWEAERKLEPMQFYLQNLSDAHVISVPSQKLLRRLQGLPPPIRLFAEGIEPEVFKPLRERSGSLKVGWAGKPGFIKRLDIIRKACDGLCELVIADGTKTEAEMVDFYNSVDIIACSSIAEGCPRPVLEGMACGCYPVSFDVGIVSELVAQNRNGMIVTDETAEGMREALTRCKESLGDIRKAATLNPEIIRATRTWEATTAHLADVYTALLG